MSTRRGVRNVNPLVEGAEREPVKCWKCNVEYQPGEYDKHIRASFNPIHLSDRAIVVPVKGKPYHRSYKKGFYED